MKVLAWLGAVVTIAIGLVFTTAQFVYESQRRRLSDRGIWFE